MYRYLILLLCFWVSFHPTHSQVLPDSNATFRASAGDRLQWVSPIFALGGQLKLNQQLLSFNLAGDTLFWNLPPGLNQGGRLVWQSTNGIIYPIGRLLLHFRFQSGGSGGQGWWLGLNANFPDTLKTGFSNGWRALTWPRSSSNQPPINAMGNHNHWLLPDTSIWIIHDTIGGNEISGPDEIRLRFTGSYDLILRGIADSRIEIYPTDTFFVRNTSFNSILIQSSFPVLFSSNVLKIDRLLQLNIPQGILPDTIQTDAPQEVLFTNEGVALKVSNFLFYGKGNRKLTGPWLVNQSLQALDSTQVTGNLYWEGGVSSLLKGRCLLDELVIKSGSYLQLHQPIRLKKSHIPTHRQWVMEAGSTIASDSSGFLLEGSNLGFGNGMLHHSVVLKLKRLSLRQLWPSGSRIKLQHPGDLSLLLPDSSSGSLDWPDSTLKQLRTLIIGKQSRWETGSNFNNTFIDSMLRLNEASTLVLNNGRTIHLGPNAQCSLTGIMESQDPSGFFGWNSGQIRGLISQLHLSDSSQVIYSGGSQTISPLPFYPHLTLSNTGIKTLTSSLLVKGNLLISGTYTRLDADTFTINLGGNFVVSTTSGNGFSEGQSTLVFTNPSALLKSEGYQRSETVHRLRLLAGCTLRMWGGLNVKSGGRLVLEQGAVLNTDTHDLNGSGTLEMKSNSRLVLKKTGAILPGLSGLSNTYQIDSSAIIELSGQGDQRLRGGRYYGILEFAGSGVKTLQSSLTTAPRSIIIKKGTKLKTDQFRYANVNTSLTLDSLADLEVNGSGIQPEAGGEWHVHSSANFIMNPNGTQSLELRGNKIYPNLILGKGTIEMKSGDSLNVHSTSYLRIDSGVVLKFADSAFFNVASSAFRIMNNGTIICSHRGGLFGIPSSVMGSFKPLILGKGTLSYQSNSGTQRVDSMEFYHLTLAGNGYKQLPLKLLTRGDTHFLTNHYQIPDSITLLSLDTQNITLPNVRNLVLTGHVKRVKGNIKLIGDLTLLPGASFIGNLNDSLHLGNSGRIWTEDSSSIRLPMQWIYQQPQTISGWRLAGFPWSYATASWGNRFNPFDTLKPNIQALINSNSRAKWSSLSVKYPLASLFDTLQSAPFNAWMIRTGTSGILRGRNDSLRISGLQIPTHFAYTDSTKGWRTISNPFFQDLSLVDSTSFYTTGIKQAFWRWGGNQVPGWLFQSNYLLLADSLNQPVLNRLAPAQAGLYYRFQPGSVYLKSKGQRKMPNQANVLRTPFQIQQKAVVEIQIGRRIRQSLAVIAANGVTNDTFPMPPFPDGDRIGWISSEEAAQVLQFPMMNSSVEIPLSVLAAQSDTAMISFKMEPLAPGWRAFLFDSLQQQFYLPNSPIIKRVTPNVENKFALFLLKFPVSSKEDSFTLPYTFQHNQIYVESGVELVQIWNLQGQLTQLINHPTPSTPIPVPTNGLSIIAIKKGGKQWVDTIFRL